MATKNKSQELEPVTEPADFTTDGPARTEVDVADIKPIKNEDSHILLTGESWVVLGEADGVPDWAVGQPAAVINAPVSQKFSKTHEFLYDYTAPDALITVRERSQGVTFQVPLDSVEKVSVHGGRLGVVNFP